MKRPEKPIISKLKAGETVPKLGSSAMQWPQKGPRSAATFRSGYVTKAALTTFVDLGLSADEIARYVKVPQGTVTTLLDMWDIEDPGSRP